MPPAAIQAWAERSARTTGRFQLNLWIPDPPPARDPHAERAVREFLAGGDPRSPPRPATRRRPTSPPSATRMSSAQPTAMSSIMGLYPTADGDADEAAGHRLVRHRDDRGGGGRPRRRAPTSSSPRAWRPAAIEAPSKPPAAERDLVGLVRAGARSGRRRSSARRRRRRHRRRPGRRGRTGPRRLAPCRSAPASCAARRRPSRRHGRTPSVARARRTRS